MNILVMSDSHSSLRFMKMVVDTVKPDAVVHLGDYYEDGEAVAQLYPHIAFHLVGGNCDRYRMGFLRQELLCYNVCGVKLFMVHGHNHQVKSGLSLLIKDAKAENAQAALYGHTHVAHCENCEGLWILNPGSCGSSTASVGIIEVENNKITACKILRREELEEIR